MNAKKFKQVLADGFSGTGRSEKDIIQICLSLSVKPDELEQIFKQGAEFNITNREESRLEEYREELEQQIDWIKSKDRGSLVTLNSMAGNLRIFLENFREEIERITEEDYELKEIAEALNDEKLAEEAEISRNKLKRIKSRIEKLAAKEEKASSYIEHIDKLEEKLGSLNQIESALENRKKKVQILLNNANRETGDSRTRLVKDVLEMHENGMFDQLEAQVLGNIPTPQIRNERIYSLFCPTMLYEDDPARSESLAAYVLVLSDIQDGDERCLEILNPDESDTGIGHEELREKITEIYRKLRGLEEREDDFHPITGGHAAYYVRPEEYDLESPEIVISKVPENTINLDNAPETVKEALKPKIVDSGSINIESTIFHEYTHHVLRNNLGDDVEWDRGEIAAVDEGAAFAVATQIAGETSHIDSDTYRELFDIEEGTISSIAQSLLQETGGDINSIWQRASQVISEIENGNMDSYNALLTD